MALSAKRVELDAVGKRGLRIQRVSAAHAITDSLRDEIKLGRLTPLTRLIETELAERLAVSRTPLREALSLLEAEGFAERRPTGGLVVAPIEIEDLRELYWLRATLEAEVIREVTGKVTSEQLAELDLHLMRIEANREHRDLFLDLGREFHQALALIFGNQRFVTMLGHVRHHTDRYWAVTAEKRPGRPDRISEEHREILAAVRSGDGDAAAAAMRKHVMAEAEACIDSIKLAFGPDPETPERADQGPKIVGQI